MTICSATSVDICIATFKRPELLSGLLESLSVQTVINFIKLRIIIIDNDSEKSAKTVVDTFFSDKDIAYVYDVQPEKNIALTRNKALDYVNADYLAFIDDDEWAAPEWLNQLLLTSQQYNADVVFGLVMPLFPENTPEWIINGGFFNRKTYKTGQIRPSGATSNALIKNLKNFETILRFDSQYGLTGGEDSDLFQRMYFRGAKLVWCNEALVYEVVPPERMTIKWLVKRALRGGQTYARIHLKYLTFVEHIIWLFKRICYLCIAVFSLPFAFFMGKSKWVWVLRKIMSNFGQLSMLFTNNTYQEYK